MKKILLIAAALLVLLLAGAGVFVATFDADRYRPRVQKEIENVLGQPVEIEKISLGWRSGPSLEVKGLNIPALNSAFASNSITSLFAFAIGASFGNAFAFPLFFCSVVFILRPFG